MNDIIYVIHLSDPVYFCQAVLNTNSQKFRPLIAEVWYGKSMVNLTSTGIYC